MQIKLKLYNENYESIGEKILDNTKNTLASLIERPKNDIDTVPFSDYCSVYRSKVRAAKINKNAIGYLMQTANDVQAANYCALLPSVHGGGNGSSITPQNFKEIILNFVARRLAIDKWYTHTDYFYVPDKEIEQSVFMDLLIYALFEGKNHTSSLKNIAYNNQKFNIKNEFFPFLKEALEDEIDECPISSIASYFRNDKDRFVASYLNEHKKELSPEAKDLLKKALILYKAFYREIENVNRPKHKIESWDLGWLQIKRSLEDEGVDVLKNELNEVITSHKTIKEKLKDFNYDYGILNQIVLY